MHEQRLPSAVGPVRFIGSPVLVAALGATLAGCAGSVTIREAGDVALIIDAGFLTGDEAAIAGTLALTETGCVGIADLDGNIFPAVWPRDTTLVDEAGYAITIPDVGVKEQGDTIEGTGGYYSAGNRDSLKDVAERCEWDEEVIGVRFE